MRTKIITIEQFQSLVEILNADCPYQSPAKGEHIGDKPRDITTTGNETEKKSTSNPGH